MSTLTLVRHGQATPFQKETDVLSPLGERQAILLADYWLKNGDTFDEVHTGTLVRQKRTEELVAGAFRVAGARWPQSQASVAWNEYDATGILTRFVPELARRDERFAELVSAFESARGTPEQNRHFQRMFEIAMLQWLEAGVEIEGVEPFHAFQHRVQTALAALMGKAESRRVVVFTSGGPMGLLVQHALNAPARSFLEVNWRVRNCSLTEFLFSPNRFSLDSFNALPHLTDRKLWSFR
jgi:broad specificity phosphatase PhoE